MSPRNSERGLTLIEVTIGLVISGILLGSLVRLFRDSHRSFDLQEQLADRNQTLLYVAKRLGDRLMEAGTYLPDSTWTVISSLGQKDTVIKLSINPLGGIQQCDTTRTLVTRLPVDESKAFSGSSKLLLVYANKTKTPEILSIDTTFNEQDYKRGLKDMPNSPDTLLLTKAKSFAMGDMIYSFDEEIYRLNKGNLLLGSEVLAEGIDSIQIGTLDRDGKSTNSWTAIRSVTLQVMARTALAQPGLPDSGYRRASHSLKLRLRNRF